MGVPDPNEIEAFMTDAADISQPAASAPVQSAGEGDEPVVSVDGAVGMLSHTLLIPLIVNGRRLTQVTMRLPDLGDIDDWGSGRLKTNRDLLARLTGLHPVVLRALKWPDAEAVIKLFEAAAPAFVIDEIGRGSDI